MRNDPPKSAVSQDSVDHFYMAEALRLARKGRFTSQPNPRVGCVLVKNGQLIGRGWHRKAGQAHAEVNAIRQAGDQANGACAYVTLEPCSHFGKTPPCADALIKAGVSRVVVAIQDPNPDVSGSGIAKLRAAGIEVCINVLSEQARQINRGFIKRMETGTPWLTIKMAMSVDGRTAMSSGESKWITGAAARADVQRLRAESSAVITGIGTLLADDAALTVRAEQIDVASLSSDVTEKMDSSFDGISLEELVSVQPLRVVLDSQARMPLNARLLETKTPVLWVISDEQKLDSAQQLVADLDFVDILRVPNLLSADGMNLILKHLAKLACNEVLLEAGSTLAGSILAADLWDEFVLYVAPKLMGCSAKPLFTLPIDSMNKAKALKLQDLRLVGDDVRYIYRPAGETSCLETTASGAP